MVLKNLEDFQDPTTLQTVQELGVFFLRFRFRTWIWGLSTPFLPFFGTSFPRIRIWDPLRISELSGFLFGGDPVSVSGTRSHSKVETKKISENQVMPPWLLLPPFFLVFPICTIILWFNFEGKSNKIKFARHVLFPILVHGMKVQCTMIHTRCVPTSYEWSYNPYKWSHIPTYRW